MCLIISNSSPLFKKAKINVNKLQHDRHLIMQVNSILYI